MPLNIYIYTNKFNNTKTERVFMTQSFIFYTQNKHLYDRLSKQLVLTGLAMPLIQWIQPERPRSYSVNI